MIKVAITGNIASGKSTVEKFLKEKNYKVLDTDSVAHSLLFDETVKTRIIESLSDFDILDKSEISRAKVGKIIFEDECLRKKIEQILHPIIKDKTKQFFAENSDEEIVFVLIPLLFEAKFEDIFDRIVLVYAEDKIRLKRLMQRSNISLDYAKSRLKCQISQDKKVSLADYVIYNDKNIEYLSNEVDKLLIYLHKNSTLPESK